jgi:hypothetical protein
MRIPQRVLDVRKMKARGRVPFMKGLGGRRTRIRRTEDRRIVHAVFNQGNSGNRSHWSKFESSYRQNNKNSVRLHDGTKSREVNGAAMVVVVIVDLRMATLTCGAHVTKV